MKCIKVIEGPHKDLHTNMGSEREYSVTLVEPLQIKIKLGGIKTH